MAKRVFFPGLDLHTRCRLRFLAAYIRTGTLHTLDAGSGNGALSYVAYRKGNRVLGVSFSQREVDHTVALFRYMGISESLVEFRQMNIYDLKSLGYQIRSDHMQRDTPNTSGVIRMLSKCSLIS